MRRRRPDDDELIPLEPDDDGPEPGGRIVEIGPGAGGRSRWRDAGLVLGAVALVAGIGLVVDDGTGERAEAETPTTVERRRTTTSTTARRPTTTSTAPEGITTRPGDGPLVERPTGSAVAVTNGDDEIEVVHLDTGARCELRRPHGQGVWFDRPQGPLAFVQTSRGPTVLRPDCTLADFGARQDPLLLASDRPGHVWAGQHRPRGLELAELDVAGVPTGRVLALPGELGGFHAVAGGLVVDVHGSVALVDADTGAAREIGRGFTLAASGDHVATYECEALACRVVVRTVGGRTAFASEAGEFLPYQGAALSPDGRWLAVQAEAVGGVFVWLVDLTSGERRQLGRWGGSAVAFTTTGSHVVTVSSGSLQLLPVDGGEAVRVGELPVGAQSFAVLPLG